MNHDSVSGMSGTPHRRRSWLWAGLAAILVYLGLRALWALADIVLLLLVAVLVAVMLSALADVVQRARVRRSVALGIVAGALLTAVILAGYLVVPPLLDQAQGLLGAAPTIITNLEQRMEGFVQRYPALRTVLPDNWQQSFNLRTVAGSLGVIGAGVLSFLGGVLGSTLQVFVVVVIALYLSADPHRYVRGLAMLVPPGYHARALEVLYTLGVTLRNWLTGQALAMLAIGIVTGAGLALIGVPYWLVLGIIAGLLNIVPNLGPIMAWVPAAAVALIQGPTQVLWVTLLFIVVQQLEGNVITPRIMQAQVDIPPVLVLIGQLILAPFFGFVGVLVAVPLTAIVLVLVKLMYVEDFLGYRMDVKGEDVGAAQAQEKLADTPIEVWRTDDAPRADTGAKQILRENEAER